MSDEDETIFQTPALGSLQQEVQKALAIAQSSADAEAMSDFGLVLIPDPPEPDDTAIIADLNKKFDVLELFNQMRSS